MLYLGNAEHMQSSMEPSVCVCANQPTLTVASNAEHTNERTGESRRNFENLPTLGYKESTGSCSIRIQLVEIRSATYKDNLT